MLRFSEIPTAIDDAQLRATVSNYFQKRLRELKPQGKPATQKERTAAAVDTLLEHPELIDFYIKLKEEHGDEAISFASERVTATELFFSARLREYLQPVLAQTDFYRTGYDTYLEAHARLGFLKGVIEDNGGWRIFYTEGGPVTREKDVQILYRLVWFGTPSTVTMEANDGRGPADFNVARGRNKTLIEMKLASNSQLEKNLAYQAKVYQKSADADRAIKAIIYFDKEQLDRVQRILKRLGLEKDPDVVLIDARRDNKPSASKAKSVK